MSEPLQSPTPIGDPGSLLFSSSVKRTTLNCRLLTSGNVQSFVDRMERLIGGRALPSSNLKRRGGKMKAEIEIINIMWEGPLTLEEAYGKNEENDKGVYQVYGDHPVYGLDVLLYIGKAQTQTFGRRLPGHGFDGWNQNIQIYLGRICIDKKATRPSDEAWRDMIDRDEKLLIHACWPAYNSQDIQSPPEGCSDLLILNWGKFRSLPEAISGYRTSKESLDDGSYRFMGP